MLQEQTQQLQALMNGLGEALKAVNSRLEDQTTLERKAFADSKVQMDAISGDIRIVREKVDETNVRLGSISQELESIRQAIPEPGAWLFPCRPRTPMPAPLQPVVYLRLNRPAHQQSTQVNRNDSGKVPTATTPPEITRSPFLAFRCI